MYFISVFELILYLKSHGNENLFYKANLAKRSAAHTPKGKTGEKIGDHKKAII